MFRDVALVVRQTLAGWYRWYLADALNAHGTIVSGLIQFVADMHFQVAEQTRFVFCKKKSEII